MLLLIEELINVNLLLSGIKKNEHEFFLSKNIINTGIITALINTNIPVPVSLPFS